jgi:methionyl-tRNA synthetase
VISTPVPIFKLLEPTEIEDMKKRFVGKSEANSTEISKDAFPLDIRGGQIVDVGDHPSDPALFVLKVNLGEEKPRQVVARLKEFYQPNELILRSVIALCNLT